MQMHAIVQQGLGDSTESAYYKSYMGNLPSINIREIKQVIEMTTTVEKIRKTPQNQLGSAFRAAREAMNLSEKDIAITAAS